MKDHFDSKPWFCPKPDRDVLMPLMSAVTTLKVIWWSSPDVCSPDPSEQFVFVGSEQWALTIWIALVLFIIFYFLRSNNFSAPYITLRLNSQHGMRHCLLSSQWLTVSALQLINCPRGCWNWSYMTVRFCTNQIIAPTWSDGTINSQPQLNTAAGSAVTAEKMNATFFFFDHRCTNKQQQQKKTDL